ncbi:MAG: YjbE family putative metal transport protein [Devosia sp.]|uniref:YjbE family putative metal transport protein n=1 Tax=Devosia sp. TaxID=1871048 RepID=UPI002627AF80|nr:YjbE family putative metal transport protein [Devosia sp.]MDB5527775.1 YjbE family putative metal transport protein [Devosia sp.]
MPFLDPSFLSSLLQVILIDLVLAGDNAVVIGLAAAGLASDVRRKAILIGILAATVLRIFFALITTQLLALGGGLLIAGGVLLLYVCWKMYRELTTSQSDEHEAQEALENVDTNADGTIGGKRRKTLRQAVIQIIIADVSMSLDNVLAVAGAAAHHFEALIIGLGLSVVMMGVAATFIAGLLHKHRWIAWVGLAIILFVAVRMALEGLGAFVTIPEIPLLYTPHAIAAAAAAH